jgi:hypothetical protein
MNKRRLQLVLIVVAFALPALLATLMQTRWFHWEPETTRNRGELIKPVIALPALGDAAAVADGHRWTVLVRVPAQCDPGCNRRIQLLGRIREAQGKEMDRVQMLAWPASGTPVEAPYTTWQPAEAIASALTLPEGAVVLIDPLGNAMMRYRIDADPTDVRKDVAHLLRWSKVGT